MNDNTDYIPFKISQLSSVDKIDKRDLLIVSEYGSQKYNTKNLMLCSLYDDISKSSELSQCIEKQIQEKLSSLQTLITQMQQKVSALPFTDLCGRFYMPDGLDQNGQTTYRMLSAYIEPETGNALIATSDCRYRRDDDQFIIIES